MIPIIQIKSYLLDLFIALSIGILAIWFFIQALSLPLRIGQGDVGAAAFPLVSSIFCFILSTILLSQSFYKRKSDINETVQFKKPSRVLLVVILLIGFVFLIPIIGFYISALIFLPALLIVVNERNFIKIASITAGFILFAWGAFDLALGVPLP